MVWLMTSMEELIKGDELSDFCRTFRHGNKYIMQRRENHHRRFMELSEYDG